MKTTENVLNFQQILKDAVKASVQVAKFEAYTEALVAIDGKVTETVFDDINQLRIDMALKIMKDMDTESTQKLYAMALSGQIH